RISCLPTYTHNQHKLMMSWKNAFIKREPHVPVVDKVQENVKSVASKLRATRIPPPPVPPEPVTIAIVGAGQRYSGSGYASYAKIDPQWAKVVAVAEPVEVRRRKMQKQYDIPDENVFSDWKELAKRSKLADAVVIATLDDLHAEPTVAFADLKYNILLEKPMAATIED
ncbi:2013_t:CDS:2, partial [Acaulospora colombiana]